MNILKENLVEGRENIICKLDFSNSSHTNRGETYSERSNSLFTEWSVENSGCSEFLIEVKGASEHPTEFDIFSEDERS